MGTNLLRLTPIHSSKPKFALVPGYGYSDRLALIIADEPKPLLSGPAYYSLAFRLSAQLSGVLLRTKCRSVLFCTFLAVIAFFKPTHSGFSVSGFPRF